MTTIFGRLFVAMFNRNSTRVDGNEKAYRHRPDSSPTPCAWRSKRGSKTSKIRSIGHDANVILPAARVETSPQAASRSIAASKSP